jgi:uncharacterized protein (DUF1330 family)
MKKGYWIARVDVSDLDAYKRYIAANGPVFAKFGAHFLVRAGAFEAVEGTSRQRNIVIEFPSYTAALDCWHSPEYQEIRKLRADAATSDLIVIEGYEAGTPHI